MIPDLPKPRGTCALSAWIPGSGVWPGARSEHSLTAPPSSCHSLGNVTALVLVTVNGFSQGKLPFCSSCIKMDFLPRDGGNQETANKRNTPS